MQKPAIPDLDSPQFHRVEDASGEQIAYLWSCLRKLGPGHQRTLIDNEFKDYRGFVYKIRGFTIGDNTKLQSYWKTGNAGLYRWHTGEVYVTDSGVTPNAERNGFENSPALLALESRVSESMKKLENYAAKRRNESKALDDFIVGEAEIKRLTDLLDEPDPKIGEIHGLTHVLVGQLEDQRPKLPEDQRRWGSTLLADARRLQTRVQAIIDNRVREREAEDADEDGSESHAASDSASQGEDHQSGATDTSSTSRRRRPRPTHDSHDTTRRGPPEPRQLSDVIQQSGWALGDDCAQLLERVNRALFDVLVALPDRHIAILAELEARLAE